MASYSAVIDLRVQGQEGLRTVKDSLSSIDNLVRQIKPVATLFDKRDVPDIIARKKELSELVKAYADGKSNVATFTTSLAGLNQQMNAFRTVASNAKVGSDEFNNSLKAGEIASRKLLDAELDRLAALRNLYTRQPTERLTATDQGPSKMVRDLLALSKQLPNSRAGLKAFQQELLAVQEVVSLNSVDFRALEEAIYKVDVALGNVQLGPEVNSDAIVRFDNSLSGLSKQVQYYNNLADKATLNTKEFSDALLNAGTSSANLLTAELRRAKELQEVYTKPVQNIRGNQSTIVAELISLKNVIPNSVLALERYQNELLDVQRSVSMTSTEFQELATVIRQVDVMLGKGGQLGPKPPPVQGPALPPNFIPPSKGGKKGDPNAMPGASGLTSSANPLTRMAQLQENLMLGAGFPLLFGGGAGQVAGGLLGSFVGTGFGGQILGSGLGQLLEDAYVRVIEIGRALNTLNMDKLRDSVVTVNAALDYQVEQLLKANDADSARVLVAAEVYKQTGLSAGAADTAAANADKLKNAWDRTLGSLSAVIGQLIGLFIPGLADAIDLVGTVARGWAMLGSLVVDSSNGLKGWLQNLIFGEGTAEKVKEKFGGINEETEKLKTELTKAVDQQLRSAQLGKKLLDIEKQRTIDATLQGKLNDIGLDRQAKIAQIESTAAGARSEALLKYGGLKDAASQKELANLLKLIDAEKNQGIESAKIVEARERLIAINANLVEQDKVRITLLQQQEEIEKARDAANNAVLAAQIQELDQRKQIAMTLGDELSTVNSIFAKKKETADRAYAAVQREAQSKVQIAAAELASVEAQKARGAVSDEAVAQARNLYNTAVATTTENLRGAAATKSAAVSAADLERRQQTVTAYTRQFADEAARASNKLNEAANAAANAASVTQALAQAEITINNVRIQSLQNSLNETSNAAKRATIIEGIRRLELRNALATLYATRAQIQAEVTRLEIAAKQVELKYKELQATVSIARAQGLMNRDYQIALENQASALRIAYQNVAAGKQIASANLRAADAVYRGAVEAANLKAQTTLAANAAGKFAGSMDRAADSIERAAGVNLQGFSGLEPWMEAKIAQAKQGAIMGSTGSSFDSYIAGLNAELAMRAKFEKILSAQRTTSNTQAEQDFWAQASTLGFGKFATGGYVTGPTLGLIGEGGEPEYIIPQSKMATAASNYLSGGRGAGIMEGGGGEDAVINIQTGPVMEMNGERYVSMEDFERGLRQVAGSVYKGLRTPAGRYATGVR